MSAADAERLQWMVRWDAEDGPAVARALAEIDRLRARVDELETLVASSAEREALNKLLSTRVLGATAPVGPWDHNAWVQAMADMWALADRVLAERAERSEG